MGLIKTTRITLDVVWEDAVDGCHQAPPEHWDWPVLLDLPDRDYVRVVRAEPSPEPLPAGLDEQGRDADGNRREYWT